MKSVQIAVVQGCVFVRAFVRVCVRACVHVSVCISFCVHGWGRLGADMGVSWTLLRKDPITRAMFAHMGLPIPTLVVFVGALNFVLHRVPVLFTLRLRPCCLFSY
jgi:uncharacterized membrane protein YphA (DoxX/SURF4 family)